MKKTIASACALVAIVVLLIVVNASPATAQYYGWPTSWNFSDGVTAAGVTDSRACADGYTRVGPGYCARIDPSQWDGWFTRNICTTVAKPSPQARVVDIAIRATARKLTTNGSRYSLVYPYRAAGCNLPDRWGFPVVEANAVEDASVPGDTNTVVASNDMTVKMIATDEVNAMYLMTQSDSVSALTYYRIMGYHD